MQKTSGTGEQQWMLAAMPSMLQPPRVAYVLVQTQMSDSTSRRRFLPSPPPPRPPFASTPVHPGPQLQRAMSEALNSGEFATSMKIGVGEAGAAEGSGGSAPGSDVGWRPEARPQLVTRNWFFQQGPPRPLLKVFTSGPIAAGTPLQVHLQ